MTLLNNLMQPCLIKVLISFLKRENLTDPKPVCPPAGAFASAGH